jgi:predicted RNA-binding Zn-ribbon protein involved in translation (DUF1610 family)
MEGIKMSCNVMKCVACGYENDKSEWFIVKFYPVERYFAEHKGSKTLIPTAIYACPSCGNIKIDLEHDDDTDPLIPLSPGWEHPS